MHLLGEIEYFKEEPNGDKMYLKDRESNLIFSIMKDLSGDFDHFEVRQRVGQSLLELLNADHFASYVWDDSANRFESGIQINMTDANIASLRCLLPI